jgi:hypothetical protein
MAGQIIVPLSGSDQIEDILPYLERVAQPGVRIVFLIHVSLRGFGKLTAQLLAIHTGLFSNPSTGLDDEEFVRSRIRSVEEQIFLRCSELREKGIAMIVSVFAGSFRKVLHDYAQQEEIHLVMMRGEAGSRLRRTLRHVVSHLHRFRVEKLPPVLLFHPNSIVGKLR